jgi:hypothetical protein
MDACGQGAPDLPQVNLRFGGQKMPVGQATINRLKRVCGKFGRIFAALPL